MNSLGTGGAERSTYLLGKWLQAQGWAVRYYLLEKRKEGIQEMALTEGVAISFATEKGFFAQVKEIKGVIREWCPDIVHSALFDASIRVRLVRLFHYFTSIESLVNTSYDPVRLQDKRINRYGFYIYKWLDKVTAKRGVDRFVAITETVKQHYVQELGIPPHKIELIYRGRADNEYLFDAAAHRTAILDSLGLPPETFLFIHVGRQEYQKAHEVLIQAYGQIPESMLQQSALICLGRTGNATPDVEQVIKALPQSARVFFPGHVADVPRWLAAADMFVFPSRYEGLGGSVIEAMSAGLPVIASDIPVLREVLVTGQNADLVPVDNVLALSQAMAAMLQDEPRRQRYGQRSLEIFATKFRVEQVHRQMLEFYQRVIAEHKK